MVFVDLGIGSQGRGGAGEIGRPRQIGQTSWRADVNETVIITMN